MAPAAWKAVPGDPFAEIVVGYMLDVLEFREQSVVEVPLGARATAVVGQLIVSPEGVDEAVNVTPPAKLKVLDRVTLREMPVCPTLMFLPTKLIYCRENLHPLQRQHRYRTLSRPTSTASWQYYSRRG